MLSVSSRVARTLFAISALGAVVYPVSAQYHAVSPADPGTALAGALRTLSSEPRNFHALVAAGRASLDMGDTQAAAGFYGRAEEAAPQSPVPKIGIGAAMTAMGDARGAMNYFDRASALGAPQSLLALDRGLAFDLLGQQSKAQSDYRVAMFGTQADEARRRLALSLAIGRDIKGASATLEPLLKRRDPGAVRTNAFVLALAGDREAARRTIDAALPGAGARFEPFFRMLPVLRPDEKALAVHLGEFPKDAAQRFASAAVVPSSPVLSVGNRSEMVVAAPPRQTARPVQITPPPVRVAQAKPPKPAPTQVDAPRRAVREAAAPSTYLAMVRPSLDPSRYASKARQTVAVPKREESKSIAETTEPRPGFSDDELLPTTSVAETPEPLVPVNGGTSLNGDGEPVRRVDQAIAPTPLAEATPIRLAEADVAPPPRPRPKVEIKRPPAPKPKVELARADKAKPAEKLAAKSNSASPYFVQLASGAHSDRMATEYKRIKARKPGLFSGRSAQVTRGKELFRLVIGPFKSKSDSGEFVNQLSKAGIDGFTYTAPDGMTFEKIATK